MYQTRSDLANSFDFVHVEEVADGHSTLEPVSIVTLCDDVAEEVQAYAEQQWGQSIFLVDIALDINLCNWLGIGLQGCLPQSQCLHDEGS